AMMTTRHLGDHPHPVVASTARELLNKSDNERSGVLSTAMSFLGLYRDPVVPEVPSRCACGIATPRGLPRVSPRRFSPDQAADPPGAEPDRPQAHRGSACQGSSSSHPDDAR